MIETVSQWVGKDDTCPSFSQTVQEYRDSKNMSEYNETEKAMLIDSMAKLIEYGLIYYAWLGVLKNDEKNISKLFLFVDTKQIRHIHDSKVH